ncbi:biogenesis of lysosome-related organelles complex 1 subunit 2-like [Petaurus breviceps papuanus]|uniref:biogenesis of lysosome-related organelles complex 1 subunit 2-like n=1 Tax=Petaurus breviceps papuanus TaxID=3040969 RepID=UPI0036DAAAFD
MVETAKKATEPTQVDITGLCQDVFSKMATYLTGELTGETGPLGSPGLTGFSPPFLCFKTTSEDYKLLENMNKLTSLKYLEMKDIAVNISRHLKALDLKRAALQPYMDQIALIEERVAALEQAA